MDRHPRRIVCLTEETTETLYLLGAQERIVGISGFTVRPAQARKEKPIVSAFISADLPKIEALKPDLVLAYSDLQADIVRELVAHGYDVMAFNQHSIAEILRMIVVLGAIVGKGPQAQALAQQLQDNLDRTQALAAALPRRPRVYFEEWPDPIITGSRWVSELIEIAGGDDVFAHLRSGHLAKQRIVSAEDVRQRQPEVILASWCGKMVKPQKIVARPGFRDLPAVRNDRIHEIKSAIILQPGPAALTDGLSAMHARIAAAA